MAAVIETRLLKDLQTLIQGQNLQGTTGATGSIGQNVFVQLLGEVLNIDAWPAVLLTIEDEMEEELAEGENFEEDSVTYPGKILICDPMRPAYQTARDDYFSWRFSIAQMLKGLPAGSFPFLPSTPECWNIRVRRLPVVPADQKQKPYVVCGLVALCVTNTPRWRGGLPPP